MVAEAPRFHEVAREIIEITEGKTIVGHNVAFDYAFLRSEYQRLFYDFKRKTICTKKLARKVLPEEKKYGLGKLCHSLGISIKSRHRASGDAMGTLRLFQHMQDIENDLEGVQVKGAYSRLSPDFIKGLPNETGVYYFLDEDGEVIYIGKSTHIRDRIMSHMYNNATRRAGEMRDMVRDIHYELTGSELVALLKESHEIKTYKPLFNRSQRRVLYSYGLFDKVDKEGYLCLEVKKIDEKRMPLTSYATLHEGREHLEHLVEKYSLCQKHCGLYRTKGACFHHQIGLCKGACKGEEPPEDYNDRVEEAIEKYILKNKNFIILDKGRESHERSVVKVHHGKYCGYGYISEENIPNTELLNDCIQQFPDNKDVQVIIKGFLNRNGSTVKLLNC
jgi:DNA polymerase-3 subunit epsilon